MQSDYGAFKRSKPQVFFRVVIFLSLGLYKDVNMKLLSVKIILLFGVCGSLMLYSGCSKKHPAPPSITDTQLTLLKQTWKVTVVTKDGVDQMADYGGFTLTFTGDLGQTNIGFTRAGGTGTKYPWPATGTLVFDATNPQTTLTRTDPTIPVTPAIVITYAVTTSKLTMSFGYSGDGFSRQMVVTGAWQFTMVPQ